MEARVNENLLLSKDKKKDLLAIINLLVRHEKKLYEQLSDLNRLLELTDMPSKRDRIASLFNFITLTFPGFLLRLRVYAETQSVFINTDVYANITGLLALMKDLRNHYEMSRKVESIKTNNDQEFDDLLTKMKNWTSSTIEADVIESINKLVANKLLLPLLTAQLGIFKEDKKNKEINQHLSHLTSAKLENVNSEEELGNMTKDYLRWHYENQSVINGLKATLSLLDIIMTTILKYSHDLKEYFKLDNLEKIKPFNENPLFKDIKNMDAVLKLKGAIDVQLKEIRRSKYGSPLSSPANSTELVRKDTTNELRDFKKTYEERIVLFKTKNQQTTFPMPGDKRQRPKTMAPLAAANDAPRPAASAPKLEFSRSHPPSHKRSAAMGFSRNLSVERLEHTFSPPAVRRQRESGVPQVEVNEDESSTTLSTSPRQ